MKIRKVLVFLMILFSVLYSSCGQRQSSPPEGKQGGDEKGKEYLVYLSAEMPDKNTLYKLDIAKGKAEKVSEESIEGAAAAEGKIAFLSMDKEKLQNLNMINADGSELSTVMNNTYIKYNYLSMAPGGGRIVFSAKNPYDKGIEIYYVESGKYKTPVRVTDDAYDNESPKFSNDGRLIVYTKNTNSNFDIYKFDMGISKNQDLSNNAANDISPVLSPDGTKIFFISDAAQKGMYDLYYMDIDGKERTRMTIGLNIQKDTMSISPNSSMIAFVSVDAKGGKSVHIIDMSKSTAMVSSGAYVLAWSGDGKKLYYAASDQEERKIVEYDISGKSTKDVLKIKLKPGEEIQGIKFLHFTEKLK